MSAKDDDPLDSPDSVPRGTVISGRYRVERMLGAGGMGEVYLVQHVHTDEKFALKVLLQTVIADSSALERFRRESRTPARIDSDHVVRVTDADVSPELKGAPFLVMEYLRGHDLDHHIETNGAMARRDVVSYLQQAARALDKAHALGIVHRDLKPENIFITRREDGSPHAKILDFGIAKFTSGATSDMINKTATSPGQIYGTPLYMAPEQAKGESAKISPQTDIWALGLIANRMLSGRDYWTAETLTALIAQVVYEPMCKPSEKGFDFGAGYDSWFLRCCNRDPDARFSTAGEAVFRLGQALGTIDSEAPYSAGQPSLVVAAGPPSHRSSEPRPLSRTELQLAQTGLSASGRAERGTFFKVAGGAMIVGAIIAAVVLTMRPPRDSDVSHQRARPTAATGTSRTAPTQTAQTMVTPAGATASVDASADAAGSASATGSGADPAASSVPTASVKPSSTPIVRGPRPRVTATVTTTPPPPPPPVKPKDPLGGRI